jgi:hypothetical protein
MQTQSSPLSLTSLQHGFSIVKSNASQTGAVFLTCFWWMKSSPVLEVTVIVVEEFRGAAGSRLASICAAS